MLRLGLIGCGEHAEGSHAVPLARYASEHPGEIYLSAACDLRLERAEEFCHKYGFARSYRDFQQLLAEEELDGCVSVMPIERIAEVGIQLLTMKMPCVIEKPLGASLTEAQALLAAARETKTPHMVSVNRRFMPFLNRALLWAREVGALRYVHCHMIRHERLESDFIWSTAVHAVDALRHIAGEVRDFQLLTQQTEESAALWYSISLQFKDGALGQIAVLPTAGMVEEMYEFSGDGFRASVTAPFGETLSLRCWQGKRLMLEEVAAPDAPEDVMCGAYNEVIDFVRALQAGTAPRPSVEDIFPSVALCSQLAAMADHQRS
jgi:predicted dehydrogenase